MSQCEEAGAVAHKQDRRLQQGIQLGVELGIVTAMPCQGGHS